MSAANTIFKTTAQTARRTRRAYMGLFGVSYDFAAKRAEKRRDQVSALLTSAITRGEALETDAREFFEKAKDEARTLTRSAVSDLEETVEDIKEAVQETKKEIVLTAKKAEAKAKLSDAIEESDKYSAYVEKVQSYDPSADPIIVKAIIDHLGIALQSRDSKFVACSDEAERKTVAQSWLSKKLGIDTDDAALDAKVIAICEMMKDDRMKDRVTFYYLAAKAEGKLSEI